MESKKKVFVIIVNWNGWKDTLRCLTSLESIHTGLTDFQIVVVDNGSTDDSVKKIRQSFPKITLIKNKNNLGFTGGNNIGIQYALEHGAEYVWLLNNDTYVHSEVLSLLHQFDDPRVGICGSKIYFASGHEFHKNRYKDSDLGNVIWYAGGIIDWKNMIASHRGVDEVDHGQYNSTQTTDFVTGCSMMIRREVIDRVGLLDDKFYLYLEDLDYSIKARRAGFKLFYVPSSYLWHLNAGSSNKPGNPLHEYYFTRNRLLVGFRYASYRTKLALIRESIRFSSPIRKKAVRDWLLWKFGNRFSL